MAYGYIRYGNPTPEWREMSVDQSGELVKKIKEKAGEHGFKLLMWGGPFGVSEEIVYVYKSEKALQDFVAMNQAVSHPMTNVRTNIVFLPFE